MFWSLLIDVRTTAMTLLGRVERPISRRICKRSKHGARAPLLSHLSNVTLSAFHLLSLSYVSHYCAQTIDSPRPPMSISPTLLASARAAYRELLRASALTFAGDDTVRNGE